MRERDRLGIVVARRQRLLEIGGGRQQSRPGRGDDLPADSSSDEPRLAAKLPQRIAASVGPVEPPAFSPQEFGSAELSIAVVVASREQPLWFQGRSVGQFTQRHLAIRVRVVLHEVGRRRGLLPYFVVVVVLDRHSPQSVEVGHHQHQGDSRDESHRRTRRVHTPSHGAAQFAVVEDDLTARRRVDAGDGIEDGRLPRAVGANDRVNLVRLDLQIEAVHGGESAETHR